MTTMWPRIGQSSLVTKWLAITIAASLIGVIDGGFMIHWASLVPHRVLSGEVWRLVTWPFVEVAPLELILTCMAIYKFGTELSVRWGERRLFRFAAEILLIAGVVGVIASTITHTPLLHLGGWAVGDLLVIAWARQFPNRALSFYGLVTVHGRQLVYLTIAITAVYAVYIGIVPFAPELTACVLAAFYRPTRFR
jgi:membrane associated rhomboid family serine protease